MSDLHEVQTGDVITAAAFNAIIARLAELDRPQETLPKTFARNDTGADVPQYGVMGIGGPTATYTPGTTAGSNRWKLHWQLNIVGETPDPDTHKGKWCVALGRIKSGKPGEVKASGMVQVRVYVNGADDQYCDIIEGETDGDYTCYLGTGPSGSRILWREDEGSGAGTVVWALVRLGFTTGPIPFMLKESLTPGGTADAYVCKPDGTIIDESTPWTIEVTDTIGDKRAVGKDDAGAGNDGALGLAEVLGDGTAAIKQIHQRAKRCKCQIDDAGGIEATDSSINVDNVTPTDGGMSPVTSSSSDLTVYIQLNPSSSGGFSGADNTVCYIEWHEDDDKWYIYEMPCAAS
jgi:hypothetical protein